MTINNLEKFLMTKLITSVGVVLAGGCMAGSFNGLTADIASTTFWYQTEPHAPFPKLPSADELVNRP